MPTTFKAWRPRSLPVADAPCREWMSNLMALAALGCIAPSFCGMNEPVERETNLFTVALSASRRWALLREEPPPEEPPRAPLDPVLATVVPIRGPRVTAAKRRERDRTDSVETIRCSTRPTWICRSDVVGYITARNQAPQEVVAYHPTTKHRVLIAKLRPGEVALTGPSWQRDASRFALVCYQAPSCFLAVFSRKGSRVLQSQLPEGLWPEPDSEPVWSPSGEHVGMVVHSLPMPPRIPAIGLRWSMSKGSWDLAVPRMTDGVLDGVLAEIRWSWAPLAASGSASDPQRASLEKYGHYGAFATDTEGKVMVLSARRPPWCDMGPNWPWLRVNLDEPCPDQGPMLVGPGMQDDDLPLRTPFSISVSGGYIAFWTESGWFELRGRLNLSLREVVYGPQVAAIDEVDKRLYLFDSDGEGDGSRVYLLSYPLPQPVQTDFMRAAPSSSGR